MALNSSLLLLKHELGPPLAGRLARCAAGKVTLGASSGARKIQLSQYWPGSRWRSVSMVSLYAILMAPVALVLLVNSFQPVRVLGIVASVLVPELESETFAPKKMLQKGAGIGLMVLGAYLISMDT